MNIKSIVDQMKNQNSGSRRIYSGFKPWQWRRITFTPDQYQKLKEEFWGYVKDAFYCEGSKKVLSEDDIHALKTSFDWLLGLNIDIKLNKGLLFTGDVGTGKSVILKGIIEFISNHYTDKAITNGIADPMYITGNDMADCFRFNNEYLINRMKNATILGIDDIGIDKEPLEITYMGTKIRPFCNVVEARADKGKCLLLTSNHELDALGLHYGLHIHDRLRQQCFIIRIKGDSKR